MARQVVELHVSERHLSSKGALKSARRLGHIPAVLYGRHLEKPLPLMVDEKDFTQMLKNEARHLAILKMNLGGGERTCILKAMERDPVTRKPTHLDFQTLSLEEKSRFQVPVKLVNTEAATKLDMVLQTPVGEVEVECLPLDCPLEIDLDVSKYVRDGAVAHVRDLPFGEAVRLITHGEETVLVVQAPAAPPPPTEAELAAAAEKAKTAGAKGGKGKK